MQSHQSARPLGSIGLFAGLDDIEVQLWLSVQK